MVADEDDWNQQYMDLCDTREKDKLSLTQISHSEENVKVRTFLKGRLSQLQTFSKARTHGSHSAHTMTRHIISCALCARCRSCRL